jgi:hypothetical protein
MMLAIPKPPTRIENPPITHPPTVIKSNTGSIIFTIASGLFSEKESF